jgi:hypothetical protein
MSMKIIRGLGAVAFLATSGCHSLDINNPNEPDKNRALADPSAIEAVASGTFRTWFIAWTPLRSTGTMSMQARTFSSSWNNGNNNFYSGIDISPTDETTLPSLWTRNTRSWQNDPAAAGRTSVEAVWSGGLDESAISRGGFYTSLSAANDALFAIRKNNVIITDAATTKRAETVAVLMQGASLAALSMNFDQGYIVDENTDLAGLDYSNRKEMRDAAIAKLTEAATLAGANTFTTDPAWTNGVGYTNLQIQKIANTLAAMTVAYYARDDAEATSSVNWTQVATLTAAGMSSGTPVDLTFVGDGCSAWCHETLVWMNSLDTGRMWTRVAHLLDPATQKDPYPLATGNPQPNSADKRLGDGSWATSGQVAGFNNVPKTANAGTDFAFSKSGAIFRPDRGFYHQSNIGHVRYDLTGKNDPTGIYFGFGPVPAINATVNDLLRAEAAIRIGGAANLLLASQLIDKTRVGRGGLSSSASAIGAVGAPSDGPCMSNNLKAKDGTACSLWSMLLYENEIELLGMGPAPYFNQRHLPNVLSTTWDPVAPKARFVQGLLPGTPREMPVPAKELGVKGQALYTFGGSSPDKSTTPP